MKWVKISQKTTRKKGKEMKGKRFIETMEKKNTTFLPNLAQNIKIYFELDPKPFRLTQEQSKEQTVKQFHYQINAQNLNQGGVG